ncbi:MAG: hypothetical protein JSV88_14170, partial [Candidatus Aminicenantes bacterium]
MSRAKNIKYGIINRTDRNRMKKISSKIPLALIALFILIILFILFNQFDMTHPTNVYTEKDLGPTIFDKSNGFYLVFALSEPPDVNVHSDEIINKYRRLFDPQFDNERFRFNWDIIAYRKMFHRYNEKSRFINQNKKDWVTFVRSNQGKIVKLKTQLSFLLDRYEKLLACEMVSDFSTPRIVLHPSFPQDHFYPYPGETALLTIARVYTALKILETREGNADGLQGILDQTGFSKKLMESARTRYTN